MTRDQLLAIELSSDNVVSDDDLFRYFHTDRGGFDRWDWVEIAAEARELLDDLSIGNGYEKDSLTDCVVTAAIAGAHSATVAAVASMFGVGVEKLNALLGHWYEHQGELPPPIDPSEFLALLESTTNPDHCEVCPILESRGWASAKPKYYCFADIVATDTPSPQPPAPSDTPA